MHSKLKGHFRQDISLQIQKIRFDHFIRAWETFYCLVTENQFLSIPRGVLSKIWHCTQEPKLQGKKRGFPLTRKQKVWCSDFTTRQFSCHIPLRFCQNSGPKDFISNSKKLTVTFNSNKKVEGQGADCIVACSDFIPTGKYKSYIAKLSVQYPLAE